MKVLITRLEQILRYWEDQALLETITDRFKKKYEPTPNFQVRTLPWQNLRSDLLKLSTPEINEKYIEVPWAAESFGSFGYLPWELSSWTQFSRRVFHVTHELQTLLALTSFERITWEDIPWPFSSFMVTLEEPIVSEPSEWGGGNIDAILITQGITIEGKKMVVFRFLSDALDHTKLLTWVDRDQLERLLLKNPRRFVDTRNLLVQQHEASGNVSSTSMFLQDNQLVVDALTDKTMQKLHGELKVMDEATRQQYQPILDAAFRVVLGLCFYLTTLPSAGEHRSSWVPHPVTHDSRSGKNALSNGAEICTVSSIHCLSLEEREIADLGKRSFVDMSAHWRRGYWRRKPGEGKNPDALKVVWVRPTLVRKDRLAPGEVPVGTMTIS